MNPTPALPWALALLDDGLRLYRRHLARFILLGTVVLVPLAVLNVLWTAFVRTQLGDDWTAVGALLIAVVQYPVTLVGFAAVSRAAVMALDGQPIQIGAALRIRPLRAISMGCYNCLFTIFALGAASVLIVSVGCPILYAAIFGTGLLGSFGGSGTLGAVGSAFGVIFVLILLGSVLITGATVASSVYALQAFALERRPFGASITRGVDLLTYRLGRNLLVFLGAGAIAGTLLIAYSGSIAAGTQSLLQWLDVELVPPFTEVLQIALVTVSQVLLLPPLPIWMAMLHRALATERDGADLVASVESWHAGFSSPGS